MGNNLHLTALRLESAATRTEEFIKQVAPNIAERTIVEKITAIAQAKTKSPRYWQNIHTEMVGMELWIWVDFESKDTDKPVPLDLFFEEGTKRHFISPKGKGEQFAKMSPEFKKRFKGANVLSWIQNGVRRFSFGHYVKGIRAKHIFRDGVRAGLPLFLEKLQEEINRYHEEETLFGR